MVVVQDQQSCAGSGEGQKPDSNGERAGKQGNKSWVGFN